MNGEGQEVLLPVAHEGDAVDDRIEGPSGVWAGRCSAGAAAARAAGGEMPSAARARSSRCARSASSSQSALDGVEDG